MEDGRDNRLGLTTLMITRYIAEALLRAERVLVMAQRRIVPDETPRALQAGGFGAHRRAARSGRCGRCPRKMSQILAILFGLGAKPCSLSR